MGTDDADGVVAQIDRVRRTWLDALGRGALDELVSMVTEDVVFLPANSPPVVGQEPLRELYATLLSRFRIRQDVTVSETLVDGPVAYEWGHQTFTMYPRRGGPPVSVHGYGMAIYRQGTDGEWRFARAISNLAPSDLASRGRGASPTRRSTPASPTDGPGHP
jgi:ketosteroid isomerase-like protein